MYTKFWIWELEEKKPFGIIYINWLISVPNRAQSSLKIISDIFHQISSPA